MTKTRLSSTTYICSSEAGTGGRGQGATAPPPIFGRSINPIPAMGADSAHPLLLAPPISFTFRHHCVAVNFAIF